MADRPILFNGAMVRAILAGRKTQTRRAIRVQPVRKGPFWEAFGAGWSEGMASVPAVAGHSLAANCPFGQPGDRLWVRETFMVEAHPSDVGLTRDQIPRTWDAAVAKAGNVLYAADPLSEIAADGRPWRPSIHMPRSACRLVLEVTDVRVERLQAISAADALAEGAMEWAGEQDTPIRDLPAGDERIAFAALWDSTGGSWEADPWVWVVGFRIAEGQTNG